MENLTQATYLTQANEIIFELLNKMKFNNDELESTIDVLKDLINKAVDQEINEDIIDDIISITSQLEKLQKTNADDFIEEDELENYLEQLFDDCFSYEIEKLPHLIKNNIDLNAIIRDMKYDYSCIEITVNDITFYLYYYSS